MSLLPDASEFDALIFDCDGTLVDSASLYLRSLKMVFAAYELSFERDWYFARTGLSPQEMFDSYRAGVASIPADNAALSAQTTYLFQENLHTLEEVELVADLVRAWHRRVPMAVASNGQRRNVVGSLRAVGLLNYFDTVVTIEDVAHGKPSPDIYVEAAHRLKTQPNRCFVLEDSDEGIQAARAAGMQVTDVRPHLGRTTH